jgi:hypothetical protein
MRARTSSKLDAGRDRFERRLIFLADRGDSSRPCWRSCSHLAGALAFGNPRRVVEAEPVMAVTTFQFVATPCRR